MQSLLIIWPWLVAMGVLILCSAFFSASEAALFYLSYGDQKKLNSLGAGGRRAERLLKNPERLLSGILLGNLVMNITYFSMVTIAAGQMESKAGAGQGGRIAFTVGSLFAIIMMSELIPKSLAVQNALRMSQWLSLPLEAILKMFGPLLPLLQTVNLLSRRLLWPGFQPEAYLEVADIERVIALSADDAHLAEQQRSVLSNIVALSDLRVDECMRPRPLTELFHSPILRTTLAERRPPSGYLLVTEGESDEVTHAAYLAEVSDLPVEQIESVAEPVVVVPWCSTAADALERLCQQDREVAAVVNELGETIGVVTMEDLLDVVFGEQTTRSERLMNRHSIDPVGENRWRVTGLTSLRHLARTLDVVLPRTKNVTVSGVLLESQHRIPVPGDQCRWGTLHFIVVEVPERGQMVVEVSRSRLQEGEDA